MIKQDSIQRVLDTARVEEVLSDYIHMKKRGANYMANCPFHDEKTPSFVISPAKGIYKCFGCGQSGNSVSFLMNHEKMNFSESIRYLANKYQIQLEETEQTSEEKVLSTTRESLMIINEYACKHFETNLQEHEEGKMIGLSYFKERGLSPETIQAFRLGYCINDWEYFSNEALQKGYNKEFLVKLGLSKENDQGGLRDFFKGRITFPIQNTSGRVIGFGARTLKKEDKTAKYLNSPENEVYNKSRVLYGLYTAKNAIPKENYCILVEGYMDVISLYQANIHNVVASSGTSLTQDQVRLIRRFTENLTILYDGDSAGIKAALRGIEIGIENGLNLKIVLLPTSHDPDSYVNEFGGEKLKEYILENAKDIVTFKAHLFKTEAGNDPVKKAELVREIIKTISLVKDNIKRSYYLKECAMLMGIEEELLARETQKMIVGKIAEEKKNKSRNEIPSFEEMDAYEDISKEQEVQNLSKYPSKLIMTEIELCRVLIEYGDKVFSDSENPFDTESKILVLQHVFENELEDYAFESEVCAKVFNLIKTNYLEAQVLPFKYYATHADTDISQFTIKYCDQYQDEILSNWGSKNEHVKISNYGDHFKKEVGDTIKLVRITNLEKLSKQIIEFCKNEMEHNTQNDIAFKHLEIQKLFLEKIKEESAHLQNVFRNT
jgi:DNA primase